MKKSSKNLIIGIVAVLMIILYNVVLFLTTKNFAQSFWISYCFIMLAIFMAVAAVYISVNGKFAGKIMDISVITLSSIYLVIEFIMGTCFMIFPGVGFNAVFIPQFMLLILTLAVYIPTILSSNFFGGRKKRNKSGLRVYHYEEREAEDIPQIDPEEVTVVDPENTEGKQ